MSPAHVPSSIPPVRLSRVISSAASPPPSLTPSLSPLRCDAFPKRLYKLLQLLHCATLQTHTMLNCSAHHENLCWTLYTFIYVHFAVSLALHIILGFMSFQAQIFFNFSSSFRIFIFSPTVKSLPYSCQKGLLKYFIAEHTLCHWLIP